MSAIRLNLVVIRCVDLERSELFYSLLGLSFVRHRHGKGIEHLSAELDGTVLELYPLDETAASTCGMRIGFSLPLLDFVVDALAAYPNAIVSAPQDSPWGRRAVIADPDGHRVELIEAAGD